MTIDKLLTDKQFINLGPTTFKGGENLYEEFFGFGEHDTLILVPKETDYQRVTCDCYIGKETDFKDGFTEIPNNEGYLNMTLMESMKLLITMGDPTYITVQKEENHQVYRL